MTTAGQLLQSSHFWQVTAAVGTLFVAFAGCWSLHLKQKAKTAPIFAHPIRGAVLAVDTAAPRDFTVENDRSHAFEFPEEAGVGYFFLWRADVDGGDFESIANERNGDNLRRAFTPPSPLSINGVAGQFVRTWREHKLAAFETVYLDEHKLRRWD